MVICTIASRNYFDKAVNLARSIGQHLPTCTRVLCVPERSLSRSSPVYRDFDHVVLAHELPVGPFNHFVFRYSLVECCTAIKAALLKSLICSDYGGSSGLVLYLDPDIEIYGPLDEAVSALSVAEIVVTPYLLHGRSARESVSVLSRGAFNLGFIGLRRGTVSLDFLTWWADKLGRFCYNDPSRGLFVDQKWIDLAFSLFPIHVLRHPGYNLAYWNCIERPLICEESAVMAGGVPLRFVHFSSTEVGRDLALLSRAEQQTQEVFAELRAAYKLRLSRYPKRAEDREWSYSRFGSGERIMPVARRVAAARPDLLLKSDDPFLESNEYFLAGAWAPPAV